MNYAPEYDPTEYDQPGDAENDGNPIYDQPEDIVITQPSN